MELISDEALSLVVSGLDPPIAARELRRRHPKASEASIREAITEARRLWNSCVETDIAEAKAVAHARLMEVFRACDDPRWKLKAMELDMQLRGLMASETTSGHQGVDEAEFLHRLEVEFGDEEWMILSRLHDFKRQQNQNQNRETVEFPTPPVLSAEVGGVISGKVIGRHVVKKTTIGFDWDLDEQVAVVTTWSDGSHMDGRMFEGAEGESTGLESEPSGQFTVVAEFSYDLNEDGDDVCTENLSIDEVEVYREDGTLVEASAQGIFLLFEDLFVDLARL